jgi:hypothetical protein
MAAVNRSRLYSRTPQCLHASSVLPVIRVNSHRSSASDISATSCALKAGGSVGFSSSAMSVLSAITAAQQPGLFHPGIVRLFELPSQEPHSAFNFTEDIGECIADQTLQWKKVCPTPFFLFSFDFVFSVFLFV